MKLAQAVQVFDYVVPAQPSWRTVDGDNVGIPICCGQTVVEDSTNGLEKILCRRCGLTIAHIAGQWVVIEWGGRGIRMNLRGGPV